MTEGAVTAGPRLPRRKITDIGVSPSSPCLTVAVSKGFIRRTVIVESTKLYQKPPCRAARDFHGGHARISRITCPCTSVSRRARPL